jgi:DNA-directed RNA polymerase specialized sigma subunit
MFDMSTLMHDVFEAREDAPLDLLEERLTIAAAQQGDEAATSRLIRAYAPAIRGAVAAHVRALPSYPQPADLEDIRSQAVVGVLEAIKAFDPDRHERLAATVATYVQHEVAEAATSTAAFTIPARTLSRFFGILRAAKGDVAEAVRIAPDHKMRVETFVAVLDSMRGTRSYEGTIEGYLDSGMGGYSPSFGGDQGRDPQAYPLWDNSAPDVEDRILVEAAFAAVNTLEKDVVGLAYGFTDYDPVPDAEIGERLGMSRAKIQRTRTGALSTMRSALGVA